MLARSMCTGYQYIIIIITLQISRYECYNGPLCTSSGLFPNPRTCLSYILCRFPGDIGEIIRCSPTGSGFDSRSKLCILNRHSKICREGPVPKCLRPGHHGALTSDPNIYFVCREPAPAIPVLYRCPSELTFDPRTETCVTMSPCNNEQLNSGFRRLPVPGSCHLYIICMSFGEPYIVTCPRNSIFNPHLEICTQSQYGNTCLNKKQKIDYFKSKKKS